MTQTSCPYAQHIDVAKALASHFRGWSLSIDAQPHSHPRICFTRTTDGAAFLLSAYYDKQPRFQVIGLYPDYRGRPRSLEQWNIASSHVPRTTVACNRPVDAIARDILCRFLTKGGYLNFYEQCLLKKHELEIACEHRQEQFEVLRRQFSKHWRLSRKDGVLHVSLRSDFDGLLGELTYELEHDYITLNLRSLDFYTTLKLLRALNP